MDLLEIIRKRLRITHTELDEEIQSLIDACKVDFTVKGIVNYDDTDPLIIQAISLYCKANFGLSNDDSEKYQLSYDSMIRSLALCGEYNE